MYALFAHANIFVANTIRMKYTTANSIILLTKNVKPTHPFLYRMLADKIPMCQLD